MRGNTHVTIGALAGATACMAMLSPSTDMFAMGAVVGGISALLPDIDHRHSTISHKLRLVRLLVFWLPHRGFTHSVMALVLVALTGLFLPMWFVLPLVAGYGSHIVADMFTARGVMLFYPVPNFVGAPVLIRTGGVMERIIAMITAVALVVLFMQMV